MRLVLLVFALGVPTLAMAAERSQATADNAPLAIIATAAAVRVADPPDIDGRPDDEAWQRAPVVDRFLEHEPNEGAEPQFRTEARIVYDDRALYVLVRMFDPLPSEIVSLLARRDVSSPSDEIKILIDSYHDHRTGYQFAVNPAGVKRDAFLYNDDEQDDAWDGVWDVATTIDAQGWIAELRVPFSQIRFGDRPEHTFGLMIIRTVARTNQRFGWPLRQRNQPGLVSQFGDIRGIRGLRPPARLELAPYLVAQNVSAPDAADRKQGLTGGADIKYGISSNLTLDATVNPDFGQVEADPAVLNLSAFEPFFEERRPFFLEGVGIFECGGFCDEFFYSRRIGREPQLRTSDRDPAATTILGAAKLTGRLNSGLSLGMMTALTSRETGEGGRAVEPLTNYFAGRAQQDFRQGRSGVGMMVTGVNRAIHQRSSDRRGPPSAPGRPEATDDDDGEIARALRRSAHAALVNGFHRFGGDRYEVEVSMGGSRVGGSQEAIARTQRSSVRYLQRPDNPVGYDPSRTSLTGTAMEIGVGKVGGGITRFSFEYERLSPGLELNDIGFLSRADEQEIEGEFGLRFNKPRHIYRSASVDVSIRQNSTTTGLRTDAGSSVDAFIEFRNNWSASAGFDVSNLLASFCVHCARGGPAVRRSVERGAWAGIDGDGRNSIIPSVYGSYESGDEGRSREWSLDPSVAVRIASRFSLAVGLHVSKELDDAQWLGNVSGEGAARARYTFARLDQATVAVTSRLDFTVAPTLSLQVYAQPFVSTGEYSDWRELADPRAEAYAARYQPHVRRPDGTAVGDPGGFNFQSFRSNAVVRWEYRPGSSLFLVWAHGRGLYGDEASRLDIRRDFGRLFGGDAPGNNTLLVKASYWFDF